MSAEAFEKWLLAARWGKGVGKREITAVVPGLRAAGSLRTA
jgi:hypothetical protein